MSEDSVPSACRFASGESSPLPVVMPCMAAMVAASLPERSRTLVYATSPAAPHGVVG
jgi:hypothetical protein